MLFFKKKSITATLTVVVIQRYQRPVGGLTWVGVPDHFHDGRPDRKEGVLGRGAGLSSGSIRGFLAPASLEDGLEVEPLDSFRLGGFPLEICSVGPPPLGWAAAGALAAKEGERRGWGGPAVAGGSCGGSSPPRCEERQLCSMRAELSSSSEL